jgi:hypothetical protein
MSAIVVVTSFMLVPHSVRIFLASVATCENLEEGLRKTPNPQFEGIKSWEMPLALLYRAKYWLHGGPTTISDWLAGESTVFIGFLVASDNTGGECDKEILSLLRRYLDDSRSLDDYDALGYTALHVAIVQQKIDFVSLLLEGGADTSLVVRSDNELVKNKDAVELALWFAEKKKNQVSEQIAHLLLSSD